MPWDNAEWYKVPIDSRLTKWLNRSGFPVKLNAFCLADPVYYDFVSGGFQRLCEATDKPIENCKGVFVVGPLGDKIIEQALVVDAPKGLVIITGCSHPGGVAIAKKAMEHLSRDILMILGGTHLRNQSDEDLQRVVEDLKGMGVQKVGATHCSGDKAIAKTKEALGDGFVTMGVGRVIEIGE